MSRSFLVLLTTAAAVSGFSTLLGMHSVHAARRSPAPASNLFESLGKIVDYNKKYIGTAIAGLTDSRTAQASHILLGFKDYSPEASLAEAQSIKAQIEAGELTFADAATQYSTCPSKAKGGSLGEFKRGAMVPEFDEVCFSNEVPIGGLEGPVKTQFGYHLIRVTARSEA